MSASSNTAFWTEQLRGHPSLDSRYGAIGIAAVLAALQFKEKVTNPSYGPLAAAADRWLPDAAD